MLQGHNLVDLSEQQTEPADFSIRGILYENSAWRRKPSAIFTRRPDADDLKRNSSSSPGQFRGVNQSPSFIFSGGSLRLTFEDIVQPDLGSRNALDPLPDILLPAKHNR